MYWHRHANLLRLLYCVTFILAGGASTFPTLANDLDVQPPKAMAATAKQADRPLVKPTKAQPPIAKILMFKTSSCAYCYDFDQRVRPFFLKHPVSNAMPLEDIDFHIQGTNYYPLRAPIKVFPTFVIYKDGKEVGRISGYMAKDAFLEALNHFFPAMMKQDLSMIQHQRQKAHRALAQLENQTDQ